MPMVLKGTRADPPFRWARTATAKKWWVETPVDNPSGKLSRHSFSFERLTSSPVRAVGLIPHVIVEEDVVAEQSSDFKGGTALTHRPPPPLLHQDQD